MKNIAHFYTSYCKHIDINRAIPFYLDCLKPIEKRILLSAYNIGGSKPISSSKLIGQVITYHPHGDKSIYDTIINLTQRELLISTSNFGSNYTFISTEAAAFRYTSLKNNQKIISLFEDVLPFVNKSLYETDELEYDYLPSLIPIGLLGSGFILGIGIHVIKTPRYKYKDLLKRLYYLLTNDENYKNIPIPNIRNCNIIELENNALEHIFTIGKTKIGISPIINEDKKNFIITGINPIIKFTKLHNFIKLSTEVITIKDKSDNNIGTQVVIRKKNINIEDIKKHTSSAVSVITNFVKDEKVELIPLDKILLYSFDNYKKLYELKILDQINKLQKNKIELLIIYYTRNILENKNNIISIDEITQEFKNNNYYNLNIDNELITKIISSNSIKKLIEIKNMKIDVINNKIDTIEKEIIIKESQIINLHNEIINIIKKLI